MNNKNNSAQTEQYQYKPKTAIIHRGEIIEPDEFYFLEVDRYFFRGRLRPGQDLTMRKGCLADEGDIVQLDYDNPNVCCIAEYRAGMKYTAVCVAIGELSIDAISERYDKKLGKAFSYCRYTLNGVDRVTPRFYSCERAFTAMKMLINKYGCKAGVYSENEAR